MTRKPKHHQRGEKFEVIYPLDSNEALLRAFARNEPDIVTAAEGGDPHAAAMALGDAMASLLGHRDDGSSIPRCLCDWLLNGLMAAAKGESIEGAMGLRRRGARNTWSLAEKKHAVALLWMVRDYLKTRPSLPGQDYHDVTARWFSDQAVPAELAGFNTPAGITLLELAQRTLRYRCVSANTLREWGLQAIAVRGPAGT